MTLRKYFFIVIPISVCFYIFLRSPVGASLMHDVELTTGKKSPVLTVQNPSETDHPAPDSGRGDALALDECKAMFKNGMTAVEQTKQKNYALSQFFRHLQTQGLTHNDLLLVGDRVGLSIQDVSNAESGFNQLEFMYQPDKIVLLADDFQHNVELPSLNRNLFDETAKAKDYSKMIASVNEHTLDPTQVRFGKSLLAQMLLTDADISQDSVEKLLAAGFPINLDAIVYAIQQGVDANVVKMLSDAYPKDQKGTWEEGSLTMNLSLAAARSLRTDLFGYFLQKGIVPFTANYWGMNFSLLDVLPLPKTDAQKRWALSLAQLALAHGNQPGLASSVDRLNKWLPEETKTQYQSLLRPTVEPSDDVKKYASELKILIDSFDKKIAYAASREPRCIAQHHYDHEAYVRELILKKPSSNTLTLAEKNSIYNYAKERQELMYKNPRKFFDDLKAAGAIITEIFEKPISQKSFDQFFAATIDKNWPLALDICEKAYAETGNKSIYAMLLSDYLREDKPDWSFIEKLLQQGAEVKPYLIQSLVRKGNLDLIEKLMPYGIDIHYVNELGQSALTFAIQGGRNVKTIEYLLAHGADVKVETIVPDPLDVALAELDRFSSAMKTDNGEPYFTTPQEVALLIHAGAPIQQSHREKIDSLRETNPDAYNTLIQVAPELGH